MLRIYGILKMIAFDLHDFTRENEYIDLQRDLVLHTWSPIYKVHLFHTSLSAQK